MLLEIPDIPEELAQVLIDAAHGIEGEDSHEIIVCVVSRGEHLTHTDILQFFNATNRAFTACAVSLLQHLVEDEGAPEVVVEKLKQAIGLINPAGSVVRDEIGATKGSA